MDNKVKKELLESLPDYIRLNFKDYLRMSNLYDSAIKEVCTRLEILDGEYEMIHERNPIHHIEKRVKTPESIFKKLEKLGYELSLDAAMSNILDIAGIRVVCYFISDVYEIANKLSSHDDIIINTKRDYIQNPKPTGYRSLHLILDIPVYTINEKKMVPVEVQLRTVAMDYYASIEHQLRYKNTKYKISDSSKQELIDCADIISETDKIMETIYKKTYGSNKY